MLRLPQVKLHIGHTQEELEAAVRKELRLPKDAVCTFTVRRRSLDARKKQEIHYVYAIDVSLERSVERRILARSKGTITEAKEQTYSFEPTGRQPMRERPVVVGAGPAGLFCAYFLAMHGYAPVILERGEPVEERAKKVERFWAGGALDPESNVQFGEGGAGTFSDGKLNTMVKDPRGRIAKVLELFVRHGAPAEILYEAKPHIGTDLLGQIIRSMRKQMEEWGARFCFSSRMTDLFVENGRVIGVEVGDGRRIACETLVAAIGHSARDTLEWLVKKPLRLEPKAFAVGVRMEHPQRMIDRAQYGEAFEKLPAADYKLTYQTQDRGVYSFCMCPGGFVVNASSEPGRLAVNGMSNYGRSGRNANSALVVTVTPEDFYREGAEGALAGMYFQRKWEELAYRQGEGSVPVQLFGDFLKGRPSDALGDVRPDIMGSYRLANVSACLPGNLADHLREAVLAFEDRIPGYARRDAVLSGVETRTSSPVRMVRSERLVSDIEGLYPCGEGAGYAGGIMSAAVDGIKVFEAIASEYRSF